MPRLFALLLITSVTTMSFSVAALCSELPDGQAVAISTLRITSKKCSPEGRLCKIELSEETLSSAERAARAQAATLSGECKKDDDGKQCGCYHGVCAGTCYKGDCDPDS